jgi:hypothetical protein
MSGNFEQFIRENRADFDDQVPNPVVLQRITQRIQPEQQAAPVKKGIVVSFRALRWAAAAVIILVAGAGIWLMNDAPTPAEAPALAANTRPITNTATETITTPAQTTTTPVSTPAVAALDEELIRRKQVLFASLNNMQSPSTRMEAAMRMDEMKSVDHDIVDALVKTMNQDPNTNVRLAALDALTRFHKEPYVKKQLLKSLSTQKDPMVQIELIQLLTRMRETSIVKQLEKLANDVNTMDAVKERAYSGILTLGS